MSSSLTESQLQKLFISGLKQKWIVPKDDPNKELTDSEIEIMAVAFAKRNDNGEPKL